MSRRILGKICRRILRTIFVIRATNYIRAQINRTNTYFVGWGMTTSNYPPWHLGKGDGCSRSFHDTNEKVLALVSDGSFQLTQLRNLTVDAREEFVRGLGWRHFIVQWSVLWAARENRKSAVVLVECGVCDGMTIYYALRALEGQYSFTCTCFDAWQGMQAENLLPTEMKAVGAYHYLSLDTTKKILKCFVTNVPL